MKTAGLDTTAWSFQQAGLKKQTQEEQKESKTPQEITVDADVVIIDKTSGYDLEHITPDETTALAKKLYKEGKIEQSGFTQMMVSAFQHLHPVGSESTVRNNAPFNLLGDLESILDGTHPYYPNAGEEHKNSVRTLLDVLYSLKPEQNLTIYSSLDIKV